MVSAEFAVPGLLALFDNLLDLSLCPSCRDRGLPPF